MSALKLYNYIKAQYLSGVLWTEFLWQDETYERQNIAYFSQVWNEFINSMREEDLISDRSKLQTTACLTHLALDDWISSIWLYLLTTNFPGIEICFLSHTVQVMFLSFSGLHSCLLARCVMSGSLWPKVYDEFMIEWKGLLLPFKIVSICDRSP